MATGRPGQVVGIHFFNPVPILRLVEVVPSLLTSEGTISDASSFAEQILHKRVIRCQDRAGFIVNALLVPYILSAIRMMESGFATAEDIDTGMVEGCNHPMGPLRLADLIGLDTTMAVAESLYATALRADANDPVLAFNLGNVFEASGRSVPVFNDKHIGPVWTDAKWTYDRAREMNVPFMAGSSLPVGYRTNDIDLPMASDIESAVGIGYSGLEIYGIHALEFYQYHIERRRGSERGVKSVQFLQGAEMWRAVDSGLISTAAFDAALAVVPKSVKTNVGPDDVRNDRDAGLFLFEYVDGFVGAVFMLSCIGGTAIGLRPHVHKIKLLG